MLLGQSSHRQKMTMLPMTCGVPNPHGSSRTIATAPLLLHSSDQRLYEAGGLFEGTPDGNQ